MRQRNTFSDFLDSFFSNEYYPYLSNTAHTVSGSKPAMNVLETDDAYRIELATPGLCKEDITIKLDEDENLVIAFDKREEKEDTPEPESKVESKEVVSAHKPIVRYLRREIFHQNFVQKLGLPEDANRENISASMENGLLLVEIPKIKEEERAKLERSIDIR